MRGQKGLYKETVQEVLGAHWRSVGSIHELLEQKLGCPMARKSIILHLERLLKEQWAERRENASETEYRRSERKESAKLPPPFEQNAADLFFPLSAPRDVRKKR